MKILFALLIIAVYVLTVVSCSSTSHKLHQYDTISTVPSDTTEIDTISIIDWRTQFDVPKIGDTWKYRVSKGTYRIFSVVGEVESSSMIPGDIVVYGTVQIEETYIMNGSSRTETKLIMFVQDVFDSSQVRVFDVPKYINYFSVGQMNGNNVILWLPLYLERNWMSTFYVGYDKVTWFYRVTNYYNSFKVSAGIFYKVWQVNMTQRINDRIKISSSVDYYYAEGIGLIKETENLSDGKIKNWLDLVSYKKAK